jgi:FKBP-type peptidyl-prolyl cis-trans isomerase (trigger factor)
MEIKEIALAQTKNIGNYENVKVTVTIAVTELDDLAVAESTLIEEFNRMMEKALANAQEHEIPTAEPKKEVEQPWLPTKNPQVLTQVRDGVRYCKNVITNAEWELPPIK